MQASKIAIGRIYAITRKDGTLARFQVTAVTTTRKSAHGNPHDYESKVEGYVQEEPENEEGRRELKWVDPQAVLGPFEEQAELKARADAEKAKKDAETEHKKNLALELRKLLYAAAGETMPNDDRLYTQPIRTDTSHNVEINWKVVEALVEYFRNRRGS